MTNPSPEKNNEGLTFEEWHTATGQVGSSENLVKAWENGEDPSEYRGDAPTKVTVERTFADLSPEEQAALVGLVTTRMRLREVRKQMVAKRDELQELESQCCALVKELDAHGRKFAEGFGPIPLPTEEDY